MHGDTGNIWDERCLALTDIEDFFGHMSLRDLLFATVRGFEQSIHNNYHVFGKTIVHIRSASLQ